MALRVYDREGNLLSIEDAKRKSGDTDRRPEVYELDDATYNWLSEKHSRLSLMCYPELVDEFKAARSSKTFGLTLMYAQECLRLAEVLGRTVVVGEFVDREKPLQANLAAGKAVKEVRYYLTAVPGAGIGYRPSKEEWQRLVSSPDTTHYEVDWMKHHPSIRLKDHVAPARDDRTTPEAISD